MSGSTPAQLRHIRIQLLLSLAINVFVLVVGVLGYMQIEGWIFLDSLYMTVITLASVGFSETHPLSSEGRVFTVFLILTGVLALGNLVGQVGRAVSEGFLLGSLRERSSRKVLSRMEKHYIVCGYGRIGRQIVKDLRLEGSPIVILDRDVDAVQAATQAGLLALQGDATSDRVLVEAGIKRARCILCALNSDAENLSCVISARSLNTGILIVARAVTEEGATKLTRVGADKIVSPYLTGGKLMATLALRPQVVDFVEAASMGQERLYIEEFRAGEISGSSVRRENLGALRLHERSGAIIIAVRRHSGEVIPGPPPQTEIGAGDLLVCMGTNEQLRVLAELVP